jgi:glycerol-3-phosphate acyltransferase PlsY
MVDTQQGGDKNTGVKNAFESVGLPTSGLTKLMAFWKACHAIAYRCVRQKISAYA